MTLGAAKKQGKLEYQVAQLLGGVCDAWLGKGRGDAGGSVNARRQQQQQEQQHRALFRLSCFISSFFSSVLGICNASQVLHLIRSLDAEEAKSA